MFLFALCISTKPVFASPSHHGWISVSNVAFAPDSMGHILLPLVNGWAAYGGSYGSPDYTVRNGICSLEGLLWKSGGPKEHFATLPEDCRPGTLANARSHLQRLLGVGLKANGSPWFTSLVRERAYHRTFDNSVSRRPL